MAHSPRNKRARVLLVDDHPVVRVGLRLTLDQQPDLEVCGEAEDGESALAAVAATHPDLLIMDLHLKNCSGLELTKRVLELYPRTLVLVLSVHDERLVAERTIRVGARGYLSKQEAAGKLLDAIRKVLGGEVYWGKHAAPGAASTAARFGLEPSNPPVARLSERELEVLELIGTGSSTAWVAGRLELSLSTVKTYRSRIKDKLNLDTADELLQMGIRWNMAKAALPDAEFQQLRQSVPSDWRKR